MEYYDQIYDLIKNNCFSDAKKMLDNHDLNSKIGIFQTLAFNEEDLSIILFLYDAFEKDENIEWLITLKNVLCEAFCYLEGAYESALYIVRQLLKKDKNNILFYEELFYLAIVPETKRLIGKQELIEAAKVVKVLDPYNKDMKMTLEERGIDLNDIK